MSAHPYDKAYYVGGRKSNYVDYSSLEPTIEAGFMPVVLRYAARCAGRSYLDVGCAMGFYVRRLADLGWDAHGVDLSEYAVSEGLQQGIPNLRVAAAQELPYDDESFDYVTAIDVIEHVPPEEGQQMVDEIYRVLRRGGVTLVATPNFLTNQYWNIYTPSFVDNDETHVNYQSAESLHAQFERFASCRIYGDTPFREQFHAFDVAAPFDRSVLKLPIFKKVGRHVAWKLLGRSVEYSSYLHAVATR